MNNLLFNGITKDYVTTLRGSSHQEPWAPIERVYQEVPNRPGAYPRKKRKTKPRPLPIPVMIEAKSIADLQKLKEDFADWLIHDDPKPLVLPWEPDRTYYAVVDGSFNPNDLVNIGQGVIPFICPDPYKYGTEVTTPANEPITNEGTAETPPYIRVEFPEFLTSTADFVGKVAGSVVENPHIFRYAIGSDVLTTSPTSRPEIASGFYPYVNSLNGVLYSGATSTVNGQIAGNVMSFNLIEHAQRKYNFTIPGATTADKVTWLKANITKITANWWGRGSGPTGNKATLTQWFAGNTTPSWNNTGANHSSSTIQKLASAIGVNHIDSNGFIHFLAYAEASNGTIASRIETDYISIEVELKNLGAKSFIVTNQEAKQVKAIYDFTGKDVLEIDLAKRKMIINGVVNMPAYYFRNKPFMLLPGENTLTVEPAGVANVEVTYRPRWK